MLKCPICDNVLNVTGDRDENEEVCKNKCYQNIFAYGSNEVSIFNKEFYYDYTFNKIEMVKINRKIKQEIEYWKNNERYLIRIMNGDMYDG